MVDSIQTIWFIKDSQGEYIGGNIFFITKMTFYFKNPKSCLIEKILALNCQINTNVQTYFEKIEVDEFLINHTGIKAFLSSIFVLLSKLN